MKKFLLFILTLLCVTLMLTACGGDDVLNASLQTDDPTIPPRMIEDGTGMTDTGVDTVSSAADKKSEKEQTAMKMNVQVGTYTFTATLENNEAVRELMKMMQAGPVTISMSDYSGFEKVGPLGRSLTTSNSQTTTTAGDIVLYNGKNIVMFYGSNSWSYTRIGKIDDLTDWTAALGSGDITVTFTMTE